jgi:DNA-binding NtrC family response regulator
VRRFEKYDWPGNVRELHNAVACQLALGDGPIGNERVPAESTSDFIDRIVREGRPLPAARQQVVAEFEKRYVTHALELHGGHVGRASEACGIGRRYFQMIRAKR